MRQKGKTIRGGEYPDRQAISCTNAPALRRTRQTTKRRQLLIIKPPMASTSGYESSITIIWA